MRDYYCVVYSGIWANSTALALAGMRVYDPVMRLMVSLSLALLSVLHAQTPNGQITGRVVDLLTAANATKFAVPNTTPSSSAFGQVTGMRNNGTQRRVTFLCKFTW